MKEHEPPLTIIKKYPPEADPFVRVDVFLRVKGRLPTEKGDGLTQEILDKYCEMYEAGELIEGIVSLDLMYLLIKSGKMKTTEEFMGGDK